MRRVSGGSFLGRITLAVGAVMAMLTLATVAHAIENRGYPRVFTAQMVEEKFAGSGIGRKTIKDVAAYMNVEYGELRRRLSKANIKWGEDQTIKQIAENHHLQPIEIVKILLVEGYEPVHP